MSFRRTFTYAELMKRLKHFGKLIVAIGVLSIFRKVDGNWTFGGYYDNAWEIITVSILIVIIGISLIFISKKHIGKRDKN